MKQIFVHFFASLRIEFKGLSNGNMLDGFVTSLAFEDSFLAVTSVEISNSLKNHDAIRENGENFLTSIGLVMFMVMFYFLSQI